MYLEHYGLAEAPFSITPDPRFVFLSERHRDALAHLLFGIDTGGGGGFVQLTGEVGTGKTTLCRLLLEQLPDNARVALVLNPRQSPLELLETICEELQLDLDADDGRGKRGSAKALVDTLNAYLLDAYARGLRVVLIIDEAQDLSIEALEQVRLLTNLETDTQKLLQVILLGQPELRDLLAREDLRQLAQRITARFHLTPLDAAETARYLRHRYAVAGGRHLPFDKAAVARLHARAGGIPRLVNIIAERSLLAGYARDESTLGPRLVDAAADEALPAKPRHASGLHPGWRAAAVLALIAATSVLVLQLRDGAGARSSAQTTPPMAASTTPKTAPAPTPAAPPDPAGTPRIDAAALAASIDADDASEQPAWRSLLTLWQLPTTAADLDIAAHCAPTLAPGVHCLRARAGLDTLAAIGRPVLLSLRDRNRSGLALLTGLDASHARLQLAGDTIDIPRVELRSLWDGRYTAIWRMAPAINAPARSDDDATTRWLGEHLAGIGAAPVANDIEAAVRRFQTAHGLASDGIIGPQTLFALSASDPGPRLLTELE